MSDTAQKAAETVKTSTSKVADTAKSSASKAATATKSAGQRARKVTSETTKKAAATAKATRAAKAGLVEDAKEIAAESGLGNGLAGHVIEEVDTAQYRVEVNKRRLNVNVLTDTLNEHWRNGWRLAHVIEQRGNTVLVFEKR